MFVFLPHHSLRFEKSCDSQNIRSECVVTQWSAGGLHINLSSPQQVITFDDMTMNYYNNIITLEFNEKPCRLAVNVYHFIFRKQ